jgi:hypothetical protein
MINERAYLYGETISTPEISILFKKSLDSNDFLYLKMCSRLHSIGFLKDDLTPNEEKIQKHLLQYFSKPK